MAVAVVTGSGGLIGSEAARRLVEAGLDVVGIENDLRATFFGPDASTAPTTAELRRTLPGFHHAELDVRDADGVERLFRPSCTNQLDHSPSAPAMARPARSAHRW